VETVLRGANCLFLIFCPFVASDIIQNNVQKCIDKGDIANYVAKKWSIR
jgi:hypothetical protein